MKRRPLTVEEPAAAYVAEMPPAKVLATPTPKTSAPAPKASESGVRYLDAATARKLTEKIFNEHDELFRKLAQ